MDKEENVVMSEFVALSAEGFNELIDELNTGEMDVSRRNEILQIIKVQHDHLNESLGSASTQMEQMKKDNYELSLANSKLFREVTFTKEESKTPETKEKEFSETITLSDLEKTANLSV